MAGWTDLRLVPPAGTGRHFVGRDEIDVHRAVAPVQFRQT